MEVGGKPMRVGSLLPSCGYRDRMWLSDLAADVLAHQAGSPAPTFLYSIGVLAVSMRASCEQQSVDTLCLLTTYLS